MIPLHKLCPDSCKQRKAFTAINAMKAYAKGLGVKDIANEVLDHTNFRSWSGSSKPEQHHYGDYGLAIHTYEVVSCCMLNANFYNYDHDMSELFLSALYHDSGKMWDYGCFGDNLKGTREWGPKEHKYKIHHLPRSAIFWNQCADKHEIDEEFAERVTHNILSHHCEREWGSPVHPQSVCAWLLHLSDNMSARLYEFGETNEES